MKGKIDPLGDWRRTAYSVDVTPNLQGKQVTIFGWIVSIRNQGGITFVILRDKDGEVQLTVKKRETSTEVLERIGMLREHSAIGVRGIVRNTPKAPRGAEISPKDLKLLSPARSKPPFNIFGKTLPSIDKRLDIRALDLRRPRSLALFKVRQIVVNALRTYFNGCGYLEVNTPKIISSATEGGASLFPILYYDKEAFLTQSPQLYKEQLVMAFEKVFEIAPAFRAEQSRTHEHLSEFVSVDVEEAYVNYHGTMETLEGMVKTVLEELHNVPEGLAKELELNPEEPGKNFERYTYDEVINMLRKKGVEIEWGDDIGTVSQDILGENIPGFYFIVDWPSSSKPFYIKPDVNRSEITESFDLMHGSIEMASGGSRVDSKDLLMRRLREQKLKPKSFEYHLKVFDYGMPPHAGFGLGLERFLLALTREENIREVTLFPRDQRRLTP